MRVCLIDLYENHDVGEKFDITRTPHGCRKWIDPERDIVELSPNMNEINSYSRMLDNSKGRRNASWGLICQSHFAVIDEEGTVLFSSTGYNKFDRRNPRSEFYAKFQEFIDNGWKVDSPAVLLSDEEDFIV